MKGKLTVNESKKVEYCRNCKYGKEKARYYVNATEHYYVCRLTPNEKTKNSDDWCGMWETEG